MKAIRQFFRLLYINHVLAKNGLDKLIVRIHLFSPFRFATYCNPWSWIRKNKQTPGEALKNTLIALGPIFIKFGQMMSTRPDLLPSDIIKELRELQDKVPPFPTEAALNIIASDYGESADTLFSSFDKEALASASIAQVHAATLKTGENVVVKILRPRINRIIEQDISILNTMAKLAELYWPESRRFKPCEIIKEFEQTLFDELDLQREAANASLLRRNFNGSPLLYIPKIYWDYLRPNVLIMERIYGIPVTDIKALKKQNVDLKSLAERGVMLFFKQVFQDCFFHADMHPGNIFVEPNSPKTPRYLLVDFGIVGTLSNHDKYYIAANFMAFFERDYRRVAQLHIESGWVPENTRSEEFESAIRTICEPLFDKPLKDFSLALMVLKLLQVARRFNIVIQPQLVLLQKTLLAVEGLGKQIYPELNLWTTAKPFLKQCLKEQFGPKTFINNIRENIPFLIEHLPNMPRLIQDVLTLTKRNQQQLDLLKLKTPDTSKQSLKKYWQRGFGFGVIASIIFANALNHFHWINYDTFISVSLFVGGLAGLMILTNLTRRR